MPSRRVAWLPSQEVDSVPDTVPHSELTRDGTIGAGSGDRDAEVGRAALSAIGTQAA